MASNRNRLINSLFSVLSLTLLVANTAIGGHGDETATIAVDDSGLAIGGYDTVAYFTEGKATEGADEFQYEWREAKWNFSSSKHKAMFVANPEKYAPQFGAFCALGVSMNAAVKADPEAWTIVDGKLYLNFNKEFREKWRASKEEKIEKANTAWAEHVHTE